MGKSTQPIHQVGTIGGAKCFGRPLGQSSDWPVRRQDVAATHAVDCHGFGGYLAKTLQTLQHAAAIP